MRVGCSRTLRSSGRDRQPAYCHHSRKSHETTEIFVRKQGDKVAAFLMIAAEAKELAIIHVVGEMNACQPSHNQPSRPVATSRYQFPPASSRHLCSSAWKPAKGSVESRRLKPCSACGIPFTAQTAKLKEE